MEPGDWVAVYAAVVATAAVLWQTATWWLERRPRVRVSSFIMSLAVGKLPAATDTEDWVRSLPWRLQIEVLNVGHSTVRIGRLDVRTNSSDSGYQLWSSAEWGLPWVLEAGEERIVELTDEDAGELAPGQELTIKATTTRGKEFADTLIVGERGLHLITMARTDFSELAEKSSKRTFTAEHSVFGATDENDPLLRFVKRGIPPEER